MSSILENDDDCSVLDSYSKPEDYEVKDDAKCANEDAIE